MRGNTARSAGSSAPVHPQEGTNDPVAGGIVASDGKGQSEKRQRTTVLQVRLTPLERAAVEDRAAQAGLTAASYTRRLLLGADAPRQVRRPPVERRELTRLLGELGRVGNNLNQIAHRMNLDHPSDRRGLLVVLQSLVDVRNAILKALGRIE